MSDPPSHPPLWLGQSVRTTLVATVYPELAHLPFMASLGDAIHRPQLIDRVFSNALRATLRATGPLMLDSGGFTIMMQRSTVLTAATLGRIYASCGADFVVALDEPTTVHDALPERRRKHRATLDNLAVLADLVAVDRLVPVVHGPELAEVAINVRRSGSIVPRPRLVALGGLVPTLRYSATRTDSAKVHLRGAIAITRDEFPTSALHVLGAGSPRTMLAAFACGADSVDSIGWRRAAGFGAIFIAGRGERFLDDRGRARPRSRRIVDKYDCAVLADCNCPPCSASATLEERIARLAGHYMPRAAHNAWTLHAEARGYQRALAVGDHARFLETRLPPAWLEVALA